MALVLLVDDEPELLNVVGEVLRSRGHDVVSCCSGREARARISGPATLDFAIIDWSLPDMSGRDLILDLAGSQPQARVIVVTGYGEAMVSSTLVNERVIAVVRKPFRMRELVDLLARTPSS